MSCCRDETLPLGLQRSAAHRCSLDGANYTLSTRSCDLRVIKKLICRPPLLHREAVTLSRYPLAKLEQPWNLGRAARGRAALKSGISSQHSPVGSNQDTLAPGEAFTHDH